MGGDVAFLPATKLAELIRSRAVSPVDVVETFLRRIEQLDGRLGCFATVCAESARAGARAAELALASGEPTGPLHGLPFTLKDNIATQGIRSTAGVRAWRDRVPAADATVTARLRAAGGILLGKVNLHELAMGVSTDNPQIGLTTRNPWDPERIPGGSSGGSAASIAAGLGPISIGSDTGGSIRGPAALCGVVGLKPTYGRVSRVGVVVNSWSLDTVGPLARTVADAALSLGAIGGFDPQDPSSSRRPVPDYLAGLGDGIAGLRLGALGDDLLAPCWPAVRDRYEAALRQLVDLGATVEPVQFDLFRHARQVQRMIASPEIAQAHEDLLRAHAADLGEDVRTVLELGSMLPATEYIRGQRLRRLIRDEFLGVLRRVDAIVMPTLIRTAPRIGETTTPIGGGGTDEELLFAFGWYNHPVSLTGLPVVSVPSGFDEADLPTAVQIVGRPFDESTILRIAATYEAATPWHDRVPRLAEAG